jgi:hypothetical protein
VRAAKRIVEIFDPPIDRCPKCGALAICKLPLVLLSQQPDDTTHVCHPLHGGCNHGFALESL